MSKRTCSVDACTKPAKSRGWCTTHYERWRRSGDVAAGVEDLRKEQPARYCTVEECDALHYCRGMCKPHYRRNYYEQNRERENANFKAYREADPDRERKRFVEYSERRWGAERAARAAALAAQIAAPDKRCPNCGETKPKTHFHKNPRSLLGVSSWCKPCFRGLTRVYQARKVAATVEKVDYGAILKRDGMVCHLCGGDILGPDDLHMDHVIPLSRGGAHSMANVKPSHSACNLSKGAKLMEELDL